MNGGIKKCINVALESLELWSNKKVAESWQLWLNELDMFFMIPEYFQIARKIKKYNDLLLKILAGQPDQDSKDAGLAAKWAIEQKEAVELNYKTMSDTFKAHDESSIRELALSSGLVSRILRRLSVVSGEKPRVLEEDKEEVVEELEEISLQRQGSSLKELDVASRVKNVRKGVGYSTNSSKPGEKFDVNAYIENKKQRND